MALRAMRPSEDVISQVIELLESLAKLLQNIAALAPILCGTNNLKVSWIDTSPFHKHMLDNSPQSHK